MKKGRLIPAKKSAGSILLISSLLIGSALLRIVSGATQAVATESPFESADIDNSDQESSNRGLSRDQFAEMLAAFQQREMQIAENERAINTRLKALEIADGEIEQRLAALKEAEDSLRSLLALADTAAEDDLVRLTSVYESMKPKDAAPLFEQMDPTFAAGFLSRMKPDAAAGVMAGLSPEAAYTISVILAGRNANVPEE
jgi:flagellar motility protein MotE (MotC chaperone)